MELSPVDIQLLYGPTLLRVEQEAETVIEAAVPTTVVEEPNEETIAETKVDPTPSAPAMETPKEAAPPKAIAPPVLVEEVAWVRFPEAVLSLIVPETTLTQEERKLLVDILKALGISPKQNTLKKDQVSGHILESAPTQIVLIFGCEMEGQSQDKTVHALPSLLQMLSSKEAKKAAWNSLKAYKDKL